MPGNYFEELPNILRQQDEAAIERARENARAEQEFIELKQRRHAEHAGDPPEAVWGPEAGKLSAEFLEFAGRTAVRGQVNFGSEVIASENDAWETRGYRLYAYINPDRYVGQKTVRTDSISKPSSPRGFDTRPRFDVWLCVDGLIRKGTEPLELLDRSGRLETPVFGTWNLSYDCRDRSSSDGSGWPIRHYPSYDHTFTRDFSQMSPVEGLRKALTRFAMDIHRRP